MDGVVQSENDKRLYRVVTLENGLTALLISDVEGLSKHHGENTTAMEGEITKNCSSDTEEDTEDDSDGSSETSEQEGLDDVNMSDEDNIPHHTKLRSEKKSAAALCIGVGSFYDPTEIPGMAHFLEHMVFMGSQKYPKENDFDDFLSRHGGESNAWTDCERTCFYFEVEQKHFHKALDKFAHFFISPLLLQDSVDREIEAVDNEFKMSIQQDSERVNQLVAQMAKPGHPMTKFLCGNTETLKTLPAERGIDIYKQLKDFYLQFYSAPLMTLVVHSRETLDTLESWVGDIFVTIPNKKLEKKSFSHMKDPFNTQAFTKLYKELTGGNGYGGFEHNSTWTGFSVSIVLTESGFNHVKEVLGAIFSYIEMLRKEGPQYWLFEEDRMLGVTKFRWKEQGDVVSYVENVSEFMQLYPPTDYLTGRCLTFEYDEQLIRDCLDELRIDNCNVMLMSKSFESEGICDQTEHWYGTKYTVCDIDPEWKKTWKDLKRDPEFYLPEPNPYIATDFNLKDVDPKDVSKHPRLVMNDSFCKVWYKKDTQFHVPKGQLFVELKSPVLLQSVENNTLLDLYIDLMIHNLNETIYPAVEAGFQYTLGTEDTGLVLTITGFSHKLALLFDTIFTYMNEFTVTEDLFQALQAQMKKYYYNEMIQPCRFSRMLRFKAIAPVSYPLAQRYQIIDTLTCQMLRDTVKMFMQQVFAECLVIGNFTPEEAVEIGNSLKSKMTGCPLPKSDQKKQGLLQLQEKPVYCQVQNFNTADDSCCLTNYYQSEPGTLYTSCVNELLGVRIKEPCFNILRTKHQLGYSVYAQNLITHGILGLAVTVECQATKFSMQKIDEHIEQFLQQFNRELEEITPEEFTTQVDSLVAVKKCEDTDLGEEASRWWQEILQQSYLFDRTEKEIAILQSLTPESLKQWYKQYLFGNQRKLSVQVVGKSGLSLPDSDETMVTSMVVDSKASGDKQFTQDLDKTEEVFNLLVDKNQAANAITNIAEFKRSLQLLPYNNIIS
ncbi:hypothetical protein ScPMuIL_005575 [Solemya velum]